MPGDADWIDIHLGDVVSVPLEDSASIQQEFPGYREGLVRTVAGGWVLAPHTVSLLPEYRAMEVRDGDVWVVTYPKVSTA